MADAVPRKRSDPARHRVHVARWIAANPVARRAHRDVRNAVRRGTLTRQPCEVCGRPAHAHHDDYEKPLRVRWLCPAHHKAAHRTGGHAGASAEAVGGSPAPKVRP